MEWNPIVWCLVYIQLTLTLHYFQSFFFFVAFLLTWMYFQGILQSGIRMSSKSAQDYSGQLKIAKEDKQKQLNKMRRNMFAFRKQVCGWLVVSGLRAFGLNLLFMFILTCLEQEIIRNRRVEKVSHPSRAIWVWISSRSGIVAFTAQNEASRWGLDGALPLCNRHDSTCLAEDVR